MLFREEQLNPSFFFMTHSSLPSFLVDRGRRLWSAGLVISLAGLTGCSGVAPSKPVSGAAIGGAAGAAAGAVAASATGGNQAKGLLVGGAAGALIGGVVGLAQEAKERSEQDRIAQERAYQQDLSRKRAEDAKLKAELDEELAASQGFRISDIELTEAQKRADDAADKVKRLREERSTAIARTKALQEAQERRLADEAEAARLEEEIARLKGQTVDPSMASGSTATTSGTKATGN